jgi:hypothetical protein
MYKIVHLSKMNNFVHIENVSLNFYLFLRRKHPSWQDVQFCTSHQDGSGSQNVHSTCYIHVSYVLIFGAP